jgi:glutathione reductase (NADPH)
VKYDLIVVGGGSGGVRGARTAASLGAKVALVESGRLGGTCVNVGCVPKKLFSYGAHFAEDFEDAAAYGWSHGSPTFDWTKLVAAKDREIERLNVVYASLLANAGVDVIRGHGRVVGPHDVEVAGEVLSAETILVATGGHPWRPADLPGVEHTWTSDDLFQLPALPRRLTIVGGGYIACEFASIFAGLGVKVDLVIRAGLPLRGFDDEVRKFVLDAMVARGIHHRAAVEPARIDRVGGELVVTWSDGEVTESDAVLMATGRLPNTRNLGLAEVGVALSAEHGAVLVDDAYRTSVPSIYAVGDVIHRVALTPVALAEAMVFAHNRYGGGHPISYHDIPTAVFTSPQVGVVGLSEAEARARYARVQVFVSSFRPLKHTITGRAVRSFVKLLVEPTTDRVVGLHVVDDDAAEITQGFAAAMRCGVTKRQLDTTIGIHPTVAEEIVTMRTPRPEPVREG